MLSSNAMQDRMTKAMSSMPRRDSHSCNKSKLGCMYACMLCSERNLGLASKAEKGWIIARYFPAMRKPARLRLRFSNMLSTSICGSVRM